MKKKGTINIDKLLRELNKSLNKLFGDKLRKCILYGSYSHQTESEDSDVDILVLLNLPKDQIKDYQKQIDDIILELSLSYDVVVSILVKNSDEFYQYADVIPMYQNIINEGKEFHG